MTLNEGGQVEWVTEREQPELVSLNTGHVAYHLPLSSWIVTELRGAGTQAFLAGD